MNAIQILVEGAGDALFLRQLLSRMEPRLLGRWQKCVPVTFDDSEIQIPTLTFRAEWNGLLIVIRAMNGVDNIFPMPDNMLTSIWYDVNVPLERNPKMKVPETEAG